MGTVARAEEILLALPSPRSSIPRATQVRGAWLSWSVRGIRDRGYWDEYLAKLPAQYHDIVRAPAAGEWYPIDVALAHYAACDALALPVNEVVDMGRTATRAAHGMILEVAAKLAAGTGATPWTVVGNMARQWERTFKGGAVGATKLGPKEAKVELAQWPCAAYRHCRIGSRGVLLGMVELFSEKAYVSEEPELCTPLSVGLRVAWV